MKAQDYELVLTEIKLEAEGVVSLAFCDPDGADLPRWQPGSHLEITLPSGKRRHYSLCGDLADRHVYRVAVLRVDPGFGGSVEVHDSLRVGRRYRLSAPRNHFALTEAPAYLFIAGGIGVTPILPMIMAMREDDAWRALYCGKTRQGMAFRNRLDALEQVQVISDDLEGRPDFKAEIEACVPGTRIYCCGPGGMLDAVAAACSERSDVTLCTERFTAATPSLRATTKHEVELYLARSGITITMYEGETVLQAIRRLKPDIPSSCEAGFCGSCETAIVEGEVEHLDQLHSEAERKANKTMMICVSRPLSSRLVLDV